MRYAEFAPPAPLAPFVHRLWVFEGEDAAEPQRIAPDGRCELILHWRAPYLELAGGAWRPQPRALFAGQLTRPLHLVARAPAGVVGVRFRTAAAAAYLGEPVNPMTDRRVAAPDAPDLRGAIDEAARLAAACAHVAARLQPDLLDRPVAEAVAALRRGEGRLPLEALCDASGLAPRVLQRRFLATVGVPVRTLASILRFRRVFEALQAPDVANWSDAAQAAGYFDHPQMARDFRRFLGCTPSDFVAGRQGLASSLVEA